MFIKNGQVQISYGKSPFPFEIRTFLSGIQMSGIQIPFEYQTMSQMEHFNKMDTGHVRYSDLQCNQGINSDNNFTIVKSLSNRHHGALRYVSSWSLSSLKQIQSNLNFYITW